ncbi:uncharacterized protein LOC123384769 isoform X5 [Felis catus]|uniref:uncharacterized protein LOC123384769 isoform X5 n=1 Tax=Felis catus TaxID=9685 RepID=UPI001D19FABA|nr:uncharacterized protein LOC123384769 isoform X5 [Felis catus]
MPHCHAHSRLSQRSVRFIVPGQGSSTGWSLRLLVQEEGSWAVTRLSQGLVWRLLVKSLSCYLTESPLMKMEMSDTSSSRPRLILGAIGTLIHTNPVSRSPQHFEVSPWLANRCQRGASAHSLYGVTVKGQGQQQIPCSPASAGGAKQRAREGLLRGLLFPQNRPRTSGRVLLELKPLAVIRMNRLNVRGTRSKPNFHHGK